MSISLSKFASVSFFASILSIGNLITLNSADAYSITPVINGNFNDSNLLDGTTGWTGVGSTEIGGIYTGAVSYTHLTLPTIYSV